MYNDLMNFSGQATELRRAEIARLAACVPPSLGRLRSMTPMPCRTAVASMLERLGYDVINRPAAHDLIVTKDSRKMVVVWAEPANIEPTGAPAIERLLETVMQQGAHSGFYVTARNFTQQAK